MNMIIVKIFIYHQSLKLENSFLRIIEELLHRFFVNMNSRQDLRQKHTLQKKNSRFEVSLLLEALCEK